MVRYRDTLWCDGCGVEIHWEPIVKDQRSYCCAKCLNGELCNCGEDLEEYAPSGKNAPDQIPDGAFDDTGG